jgi:hypothetical protein
MLSAWSQPDHAFCSTDDPSCLLVIVYYYLYLLIYIRRLYFSDSNVRSLFVYLWVTKDVLSFLLLLDM